MKQRNHTFDFLCGLCIIRMVMLHTFQYTGHINQGWWKELMAWSFFLMCFFFFKAGYFNRTVSGPTLPYLADRTKRLFVPYICCGLIGTALFWFFRWFLEGRYSRNPIKFAWEHIYNCSDFYGNTPIWFIFSFFMMYVAVHFVEKLRHAPPLWVAPHRKKRTKLLSSAVVYTMVLLLPWVSYWLWRKGNPLWLNLNNVCMGIFFFYLGRTWRWLTMHLGRRWEFVLSVVLLSAFVTGNLLWHGEYTMHSNAFAGNPWGAIVNTILVACGLSGLFLSLRLGRVPLIGYIGQHSMVYFALHFPVLFIYRNIWLYFHTVMRSNVLHAVAALVLIFAFCTFITPYFERVPFLSGRWKNKSKSPQA